MASTSADVSYQVYLGAASRYPVTEFTTCAQLENMAVNLQAEIDEVVRKRAAGSMNLSGSEKYIAGFTRHLQTISSAFQNRDCQEQRTQADQQQAIDNNLQVLEGAANLAQKTNTSSKTATVLVWSMIGLLVIVGGIIFIKKVKSKK